MEELRVGVLGFGGMGHYHSTNVKVPGVHFVAACDLDAEQLADAEKMGLKPYLNDEDAFFADSGINTVLLTVPNHLHKQYAIKAAKAGKNIICEKPAALCIEDFDEMTRIAKECRVLFEVHQNRRWDKDFRIIKKVYDENLVGNIFNIESTLHAQNCKLHGWHEFKRFGGGMIWDWSVHLIDQALFLIQDKIDTVYADLKRVFCTEVDDYYKIIIKFRGGQSITISHSTYGLKPAPRWLVMGDRGTVVVETFAGDGHLYKTTEFVPKLPPRIELNPAGPTRSFIPLAPGVLVTEDLPAVETSWLDYYRNWVDVLNGKGEFKIKNEEVRRVLAVIEAIFESGKTGLAIPFKYDN
ncbi:oxidoreductase [Spirochaetia bacterium]|nr:oxidoreductase [Spirochaetia bacterium]